MHTHTDTHIKNLSREIDIYKYVNAYRKAYVSLNLIQKSNWSYDCTVQREHRLEAFTFIYFNLD